MIRRVVSGRDDPALAETVWPLPDADLEDVMFNGIPDGHEELAAAAILAAYRALIADGTTKQQTQRLAALRRVWRRRSKP